MFPLLDNFQRPKTAWATYVILFIMVLISTIVWLQPINTQRELTVKLGFLPFEFTVYPWRSLLKMISASFLHGDFFHLLGNCLFLFVFGRSLEGVLGSIAVLILFPLAGIGGFCLHWVLHANSIAPVIGASASISTVLGAYLVLFPRAKIKTLIVLGWFFRVMSVPAWIFLFYWAALQALSLFLGLEDFDSVAYSAHVGGFILGVITAMIWKVSVPLAEERLQAFEIEAQPVRDIGKTPSR